jgi:hypothetical protein
LRTATRAESDHPLGCYRPHIPDRVVFEKLVQVLVFGCAYWRISDRSCSATTLMRRRDEWIDSPTSSMGDATSEAMDEALG